MRSPHRPRLHKPRSWCSPPLPSFTFCTTSALFMQSAGMGFATSSKPHLLCGVRLPRCVASSPEPLFPPYCSVWAHPPLLPPRLLTAGHHAPSVTKTQVVSTCCLPALATARLLLPAAPELGACNCHMVQWMILSCSNISSWFLQFFLSPCTRHG